MASRTVVFEVVVTILILVLPKVLGQSQQNKAWGPSFNSTGAHLTIKEVERVKDGDRTAVTYNLFASGIPTDLQYGLWSRLVGSNPQPISLSFLNKDGKVVAQLENSARGQMEDPINLKVVAGKGEPKQFALVSQDGSVRAFAEVVPFPMEYSSGPCHLSVTMNSPNYESVIVKLSGVQGKEALLIDSASGSEQMKRQDKANEAGEYVATVLPFEKGKRSGRLQFDVESKSCKIGIDLPWGEGSYQLQ